MAASRFVTPFDAIPNFILMDTVNPVIVAPQGNVNWSTLGASANTNVIIAQGTVVTITDQSAVANHIIVAAGGILRFDPGVSTRLIVTDVVVLNGGTFEMGTALNPVAASVRAELIFADTPIDTNFDPLQYGHGLIGLGTVTMYGAAKPNTFMPLAVEAKAGDTTLTLSAPATGWRVGDRLYFPDSRQLSESQRGDMYPGQKYISQSEMLSIAGISADGLTLTLAAPLQFDHLGARDGNGHLDFLPYISNLTRNVVVRSQNARGVRGYTLFTYRADVDIHYAQFTGLGRTRIDPLDNTTFDRNGNVTRVGTNQQGRYSVYFDHLYGSASAPANGYQYDFVGNAVFCPINPMPFRWGIAINDSHYGRVKDNVLYNWAGASLMVEGGNASFNVIDHNFAAQVTGTWARTDAGEVGTAGTGFWLSGPNNYFRNNVVAGVNPDHGGDGYGITIYFQGGLSHAVLPAQRGSDPTLQSQGITVNLASQPILDFSNNEIYQAKGGLTYWFVGVPGYQPLGLGNGGSVIKGLKGWNTYGYFVYNYPSNRLAIDGLVYRGAFTRDGAPSVINGSDYLANNWIIRNCDIQGAVGGISLSTFSGSGTQTVENTYLRNLDYDIGIPYQWSSGVPTSNTVIIRNDRFGAVAGRPLKTISMGMPNFFPTNLDLHSLDNARANIMLPVKVYVYDYDGTPGDNFQLYFSDQAANVVVPVSTGLFQGAPVAGLTNAQLWAQYGIAVGGAVAPSTAKTRPGINGLADPF